MGSSETTQRRFEDVSSSESDGGDEDLKDVEMAPLVDTDGQDIVESALDSPSGPANQTCIDWLTLNVKKQSKVLSACSFYSFCSVSMVLVNKSLASRYVTVRHLITTVFYALLDIISHFVISANLGPLQLQSHD